MFMQITLCLLFDKDNFAERKIQKDKLKNIQNTTIAFLQHLNALVLSLKTLLNAYVIEVYKFMLFENEV